MKVSLLVLLFIISQLFIYIINKSFCTLPFFQQPEWTTCKCLNYSHIINIMPTELINQLINLECRK